MDDELTPVPIFLEVPAVQSKEMFQTAKLQKGALINVAAGKVLSGLKAALESVVGLVSEVDTETGDFSLDEVKFAVVITAEGEVGLKPIGSAGVSSAAEISVTFTRKGK